MKIAALLFAVCASAIAASAAPPVSPPAATTRPGESTLKSEKERMSYALGLQIGMNLKGVELDTSALSAGVKDAASGSKFQLTDDQIKESLMALQKQVMEKANAEQAAQADANQKAGDKYLADNAKKEGVKTTASGLQYRVIKSGSGKTPKATDVVTVNYRGTLTSGKEFDASNGKPVSFPVNRVIPGWTEALQLMKEGDTWQLVIPSKLAYAERGAGEAIGPNETLVFEVELVSVKPGTDADK